MIWCSVGPAANGLDMNGVHRDVLGPYIHLVAGNVFKVIKKNQMFPHILMSGVTMFTADGSSILKAVPRPDHTLRSGPIGNWA